MISKTFWFTLFASVHSVPFIIGVVGFSSGSKTWICDQLHKSLIEKYGAKWAVLHLKQNDYYKDVSLEKSNFFYDWDDPASYDFRGLVSDLQELRKGNSIRLRKWDHNEWKSVDRETSPHCFKSIQVVIIEGRDLFHRDKQPIVHRQRYSLRKPGVLPLLDYKVYVDMPLDQFKERRSQSDQDHQTQKKRFGNYAENVTNRLQKALSSNAHLWSRNVILPSKKEADVIIEDDEIPNLENSDEWYEKRFRKDVDKLTRIIDEKKQAMGEEQRPSSTKSQEDDERRKRDRKNIYINIGLAIAFLLLFFIFQWLLERERKKEEELYWGYLQRPDTDPHDFTDEIPDNTIRVRKLRLSEGAAMKLLEKSNTLRSDIALNKAKTLSGFTAGASGTLARGRAGSLSSIAGSIATSVMPSTANQSPVRSRRSSATSGRSSIKRSKAKTSQNIPCIDETEPSQPSPRPTIYPPQAIQRSDTSATNLSRDSLDPSSPTKSQKQLLPEVPETAKDV